MSLLDQLRVIEKQVEQRLRELAPMVAEHTELEKVAARLGLKREADRSASASPSPSPAATRKAPARKASTRKAGKAAMPKPATPKAATTRAATAAAATASAATPKTAKPKASTARTSKRPGTASRPKASAAAKPRSATRSAATGTAKTRPRRRAAAPGSRERDVMRLVNERPGISVPEIAKDLNVDATGIYGVVRRLQAKGQLRKDGTALHAAGTAETSGAQTKP